MKIGSSALRGATMNSALNNRIMQTLKQLLVVCAVFSIGATAKAQTISLSPIGTYATGTFDVGASEVVDFDAGTQQIYSTNADANTVDIIDASDPTSLSLVSSIDMSIYGAGVNSVTVIPGANAIAVAAEASTSAQDPGDVVLFDLNGTFIASYTVGALPDMVLASPDGNTLVVACEGEPDDDYIVDPNGTIGIIDISGGTASGVVTLLDFSAYNGAAPAGVRIYGPGATVAQDMEPEHVAISADSQTAWVICQENNAIAVVDLSTNSISALVALGTIDHSLAGFGIDASNDDGVINIQNWPVKGFFLPDGMDSYEVAGTPYVITANEGDSRDYDGFSEEDRVKDLTLDPAVFPNAATLQQDAELGRLKITTTAGDAGLDGDYEELYSYGTRSFSIWDAAGNLVWDSGDAFEQITATQIPGEFNSTNDDNTSFDNRSDDKGPEPEAVEIAEIYGQFYAFIGLERVGGIMVYNVTNPNAPVFVQYLNNRDWAGDLSNGTGGDSGVETLKFVSAANSPNGKNLLISGNEVSGTVTVFEIDAPYTLQLLHASDLEGGVDAIDNASRFGAIMDYVEDEYSNTIRLSAGDNYIPGPFFNAAADRTVLDPILRGIYNDIYGPGTSDDIRAAEGRADITIMNILEFDASAVGNHEFDATSDKMGDIIGTDVRSGPQVRWLGAQFPYLSANLDFSGDGLGGIYTSSILSNTDFMVGTPDLMDGATYPKLAPATLIERGGETIGVVGATTQIISTITSVGGVTVIGPSANDMPALAAVLQPVINDLINVHGANKIVLVSHLQQFALEQALLPLLNGVDVIVAGGSDAILADGTDVLNPGDVADGTYPYLGANADGDPAAIVSTDGEYSYVGRLVVDFDENGVLIPSSIDPAINGPIASTDASVTALWGDLVTPFAAGTKGEKIEQLTNAIEGIVIAQDGNIFGKTAVFLEGRRDFVRSEETNMGNLTADANLAYAQSVDPTVQVSLKNGGGIRAAIGEIVETSPGVFEELPPQTNPLSGKQEREVSQLDILNTLRFNNSLTVFTLTATQLVEVLNHGVAAWAPGATPGQMIQVGGVMFSFDPNQAAGSRVQTVALTDSTGAAIDTIAISGAVVGDPNRTIRCVSLNFLVGGGDSYPYPTYSAADPALFNEVDLSAAATQTGAATFADDGTEQDALAEYFAANFSTIPYLEAETSIDQDLRIQNTDFVADNIIDRFNNELIFSHCGRMDFLASDNIITRSDPAVVAEFGVGDQTDDGYQFWFTNESQTYTRRAFISHAKNVLGVPSGPAEASHLRIASLNTAPLPLDEVLQVRVRSRVNGVNGAWGNMCEVMILSAPPACPETQLVFNPASPNLSCGVVKTFGQSEKIYAEPLPGANRYKFSFVEQGGTLYRNIASSSPGLVLRWNTLPLIDGTTYDVSVAASFDGGTSYCEFGPACDVSIVVPQSFAGRASTTNGLTLGVWPNPVDGDVVNLALDGLDMNTGAASVELVDMTGRVVAQTYVASNEGSVNTSMNVPAGLTSGLYLIQVRSGSSQLVERVVIK